METNNETVGNVHDDMLQVVADEFGYVAMAQSDFVAYAERFAAANKREMVGLRALVKELADGLSRVMRESKWCDCGCDDCEEQNNCNAQKMRELLAKAREVCK